jgi:hypothetical protein
MNKLGSEVMCRVESMSIRDSLSIPHSFSTTSKPFNEENLIRLYIECPSKFRNMFLQTIVKRENFFERFYFPMNVSIMVIEFEWVYSLSSHILGLDNEKYVVEFMLSFL